MRGARADGRAAGIPAASSGAGRFRTPAPYDLEGGPFTESQLAMKRAAFWETQTSGRREVWDNLRVVCESLLAGNGELAATVIDSADIRVPGGDLSCVYDALGASYLLPRYLYASPRNIISERDMATMAGSRRTRAHDGPVIDVAVTMRLSASGSTMEQDVKMTLRSDNSASDVKRQLHEYLASGAADQVKDATTPRPNIWRGRGLPPQRQRLMFRGREMGPDVLVQEAGIAAGAFIQVFVRPE